MGAGDRGLTSDTVVVVGRLGRPHGVSGELRVEVMTDFPERRFAPGSRLVAAPEGMDRAAADDASAAPREVVVRTARPHGDVLLVSFEGVPDRTAAADLTGLALVIDAADAVALGPDAFYEHQLVGCAVVTPDGTPLGSVTGVTPSPAADLLRIRLDSTGADALVPMVAALIQRIDLQRRQVIVDPIPGLLD